MYDPKFSQKQMYDQYGRSRPSTKRTDPKPSRSSGFSGMGADPAERFGGSPTKGIGAKPVSKPFERGSTYDEVPTPTTSKPADPSNIEKVKNKFIDLMKSFGAEDPKEVKVNGKAVYKGPMFKPYEGRIVSSYPFMTMKEVPDNIPIDVAAMDARIRDAVDYSKAPPLVYTAYGSTYDEIPPFSANKNLVKNAVNTFLKQRGLGGKEYTIKRGDTLSEIAQREGVTVDDLVKINKIKDKDRIYTGETLIIPPPEQVENIKDFVDSVDPDAQFSQSGVPMDQRIFEPELGYDEIPLPSEATVDKKIAGLGARPEVTVTELDAATGFEGMGPDPSEGQIIETIENTLSDDDLGIPDTDNYMGYLPLTPAQRVLNKIAIGEGAVADKLQRQAKHGIGTTAYDMVYNYGNTLAPDKPITQMTIKEVFEYQKKLINATKGKVPGTTRGTSAVGKYQFVKTSLFGPNGTPEKPQKNYWADKLKLTPDMKFTPALQEKIARLALKETGYDNYVKGKKSQEATIDRIADIWASVEGNTYGQGTGTTKAELASILDTVQPDYMNLGTP